LNALADGGDNSEEIVSSFLLSHETSNIYEFAAKFYEVTLLHNVMPENLFQWTSDYRQKHSKPPTPHSNITPHTYILGSGWNWRMWYYGRGFYKMIIYLFFGG